MISGLIVSVEVNGDLTVEGDDMVTLSLRVAGVQFTVIFTSVSTADGGSVAVQINVTEVPSYSGLFGTTRVIFGLGTVDRGIITIMRQKENAEGIVILCIQHTLHTFKHLESLLLTTVT